MASAKGRATPRKKTARQRTRKVAARAGRPALSAVRRGLPIRVRAKYDAAATTHDNRRHWANADALSADAAASPAVRRTLRNRARYEIANNSYARGIVDTLANDTIGTGPRLQLLTESDAVNRRIERDFTAWARQIKLAKKLRTMRIARAQDGETFAIFINNPRLRHAVKLDLWLIEAERVTAPSGVVTIKQKPGAGLGSEYEVDGIRYDEFGNPVEYRVLKAHPGGATWHPVQQYLSIPAPYMIHNFRQQRPEQHRGIPEITPALPLFAQLRRFTLAVLAAAESAADFAGILHTDAPSGGESDNVEPMDLFELEPNMLLTMPKGWKMSQVESTQPPTTYGEFKREILKEIARCLNVPYNVAAGDSSGMNYASGRLDHQTYYKAMSVDQAFIGEEVLDPLLTSWLWEYLLEMGAPPAALSYGSVLMPNHSWFWDGMQHVDPAKEAKAQELRLKNHTTTLAREYAQRGLDWETELRQLARERKLKQELELPEPIRNSVGGMFDDVEEFADELASRRQLQRGGI